ncbi:MAG: thiol peroxidase [Cycloclasticus pugetii]|jgi:thiol peroxidase|uniref:Thiol peroxidase n=2 Tax=Cycloclasticus TaxID=34067 RepID=S5TUV0_9GAMM|nr:MULTISPECIES: thiol peroxidase [Cycloclasticus]AFT67987.1 Thiol peroxidase [Cycloclasticus sp. P1]AGS38825.1 Peroxiredoxin [Cycloclasticus zancles 78-ME]ATI02476.1 thiol peroxidase [Cycloclasticus sp. PY97N]EPD12940.1 Thiol peroxidase [Cycloclasticus pugetii]MBV1898577.1 thiol peroxidase [Cycloclasticus sp.]
MATITLQSNEIHTNGDVPAVGSNAPDFSLTTKELADVSLADYAGKKKIISIVPSLDTPTCQLSTKKLNEYAKSHPNTVILVVSADLPFAMSRFCGDEGLENVVTLSMMRDRNFAKDYGVLIGDGPLKGITARALISLDENNNVKTSELVAEIADEPDYETALAAL